MRSLIVTAALLAATSAFALPEARYVRWECQAFFGNNGYAYYYKGYSDWYPPSTWNDQRYKTQAEDAALDACGQQSGGIRCYTLDCTKQDDDGGGGIGSGH